MNAVTEYEMSDYIRIYKFNESILCDNFSHSLLSGLSGPRS